MEQYLGGVVVLLDRKLVEIVDQPGHELLVFEYLLEQIDWGPKLHRRLVKGFEHDTPTALVHVIEELHGVLSLFLALRLHPMGEARQIGCCAVGRHRKVQIGRVEFGLDLFVDRAFHRLVQHAVFLPESDDYDLDHRLCFMPCQAD